MQAAAYHTSRLCTHLKHDLLCRVGGEQVACAQGSAWLTRHGEADAAWFFPLLRPAPMCAQPQTLSYASLLKLLKPIGVTSVPSPLCLPALAKRSQLPCGQRAAWLDVPCCSSSLWLLTHVNLKSMR